MAKRDPDPEPLDEDLVEPEVAPAGERLRVAREEKGLSLEDIAAQTRIPQRHLASIETGDWDNLPAPTYTIGFAKSYASAVGLDRTDIGNQLREEMGGQRFASMSTDVFEPADPARTMPKWLVLGAILAVVVLIALMSWLNNRSLDQTGEPQSEATAPAPTPPKATTQSPAAAPSSPAAPATAQGPVGLTATAPVWLEVREKGGATLFSGMLQPGQTYAVPANATAPVLKTGKPEALRVSVGTTVAPPVGPAATTVSNVSLLPTDVLRGAGASAAAVQQPGTARVRRSVAPPPAETPPTTNTTE
jgi:cytoskeleton protein RodZ